MQKAIWSITLRGEPGKNEPRASRTQDPDLQAIVDIVNRGRPRMDEGLMRVFERVRPILNRKPASESSIGYVELPPGLKEKLLAMPDAEERIRAIVEFRLSVRPLLERDG